MNQDQILDKILVKVIGIEEKLKTLATKDEMDKKVEQKLQVA